MRSRKNQEVLEKQARQLAESYDRLQEVLDDVDRLSTSLSTPHHEPQEEEEAYCKNEQQDLPDSFVRRPRDKAGVFRTPHVADFRNALYDLAEYRSIPGITRDRLLMETNVLYAYLRCCSYVAVRLMRGMCSVECATLSWSQHPSQELQSFIVEWLCNLLIMSWPSIPLYDCEDRWIAYYMLMNEWDNLLFYQQTTDSQLQLHGYNTRGSPLVFFTDDKSIG